MLNAPDATSTRPYLLRAMHEWCTDHGYTPYMAVVVDGSVQVPMEFVKGGEIVLNVSYDATNGLVIGNEYVEFKARFGGVPRDIMVPITHVLAIYARENGQGMAFPMPSSEATPAAKPPVAKKPSLSAVDTAHDDDEPPPPPSAGGAASRPTLTRVK
jgi:stringent starvation protein B